MKTITLKLDQIKPYPANAKKHSDIQVRQVAESIREFGFNQPLVVDKNHEIIVGHGRFEAAKMLGLETVPVLVAENLSETQVKAYRLADNKLNESDWDNKLVIEELKSLDLEGFDITLTGFDKDLLLEKSVKDDEVPEDAPPVATLGDIWKLGQHFLLVGDATDHEAIATFMGGVRADLLLTDPPYNVAYEGKTKDALKIKNDSMSDTEFRAFLAKAFQSADMVMKPGAVFYIWHADSEGFNFRGACRDVGWQVRQCLIWNKNVHVMGRQDYHWKHEPCLYGWKDGSAHLWNADRTQNTVLNFDKPARSEKHPTMKPVDLIAYQITNNTKGEDVVLDLFGGSGTTLIAAEKTKRVCYTVEIDPKYADVIIKRWEEYTNQKAEKLNVGAKA